ncbi:MAG TPA: hypothetical protein VKI45_09330 [Allosphingosinicella sp.]|nr:hypothetical protein [Allosphingosinicella sp.]
MILNLLLAGAAQNLAPPLTPMAPLVGHCWTAELSGGQRDTHCFEAMYGGRFIRDRHVVAGGGGRYEGETLYGVEAGQVAYTYWSSDGETMRGAMHGDGPRLDFGESVSRDATGAEIRIRTDWILGAGSYDAHWVSSDPRFSRSMHYVLADRSAAALR